MELSIKDAFDKAIEAHKTGKAQEADRYYTAILKAQPNHPDANHNMGVLAVGIGKVQEALPFFKKAIEANPNIPQFWLSLVDALVKLNQTDAANEVVSKLQNQSDSSTELDTLISKLKNRITENNNTKSQDNDPSIHKGDEPPQAVINSIYKLYQNNLFQDVISKAQEHIIKYPNSIEMHSIMGAAFLEAADPKNSILHFYKCTELQPSQAIHQFNLANAYKLNNKFDHAINAYEKAIQLDKLFLPAYFNLGNTYKTQSNFTDARKVYGCIIEIQPDNYQALDAIGMCYNEELNYSAAVSYLNKAIEVQPSYAEAYNNLGISLRGLGKLHKAKAEYEKALSINPRLASALTNLATIQKDQGQINDAIENYNRALKITPDFAEGHYNLAVAYKENNQTSKAEKCYNRAIDLQPNFKLAHNNLANIYRDWGKYTEAITHYEKALKIDPFYKDAELGICLTNWAVGLYDEAKDRYLDLLDRYPTFLEGLVNLGNLYSDVGDVSEALDSYQRALELDPKNCLVHRHISTVKRYASANDAHFCQMLLLYNNKTLSINSRSDLCFGLFKAYEDVEQFEQAIKFLHEGNETRKQILEYDISKDETYFSEARSAHKFFKKNELESHDIVKSVTPIFIIGMPRSGTTLIEQIVSAHPKVFGAGELPYMNLHGGALGLGRSEVSNKTITDFREQYMSELIERAQGHEFITDKMPQNFMFTALICAAFPEAKIIHINRDYVATCWSNYKHYFSTGAGMGFSYNLLDIKKYFIMYRELMEFWKSEYSDRIYNIDYEELVTNPKEQTEKLIRGIDLEWDKACLSPHKNRRVVRTASHHQVRKKIYSDSSKAWLKYKPFIGNVFDDIK